MFESFSKEATDTTPLLPRHQVEQSQAEKVEIINRKANMKKIVIALVASIALLSLLVYVGFHSTSRAARVTLLEEETTSTLECDPNECESETWGYCTKYKHCPDPPTSMPTTFPSPAPT